MSALIFSFSGILTAGVNRQTSDNPIFQPVAAQTATPKGTRTPKQKPTVSPSAMPSPSVVPMPEPTGTPVPMPSPSGTPYPLPDEPTSSPTPFPSPSGTPVPMPSPSPTGQPMPSPTITPGVWSRAEKEKLVIIGIKRRVKTTRLFSFQNINESEKIFPSASVWIFLPIKASKLLTFILVNKWLKSGHFYKIGI